MFAKKIKEFDLILMIKKNRDDKLLDQHDESINERNGCFYSERIDRIIIIGNGHQTRKQQNILTSIEGIVEYGR